MPTWLPQRVFDIINNDTKWWTVCCYDIHGTQLGASKLQLYEPSQLLAPSNNFNVPQLEAVLCRLGFCCHECVQSHHLLVQLALALSARRSKGVYFHTMNNNFDNCLLLKLKHVQLYGTLGLHHTMTRWKTQGVIKHSVIYTMLLPWIQQEIYSGFLLPSLHL
jgi:hypothetical protein